MPPFNYGANGYAGSIFDKAALQIVTQITRNAMLLYWT